LLFCFLPFISFLQQEEYNKLKQNRPHRVPTRNELKEHMHKFNEMMKVHQEQQQKNHVENIRALRQARKKMEVKLGSIESVYVSDQEIDGIAGSGGEGEMMSEGSPSPNKKLKRQHREKEKNKVRDRDSIDGANNNHDDDDSVITTESSPNKFQSSSSSSPLKKRYTTPANKMEVISSAAPISPRSPRIPAGEKLNTKSGANSPRSMKTKKVKEVEEEDGERESSREGKSLFGADGDDEVDSDKPLVGNKASDVISDLATPRAVATEVTNDWLGRLLSAESLAMFD
jgi:hypothetical protein